MEWCSTGDPVLVSAADYLGTDYSQVSMDEQKSMLLSPCTTSILVTIVIFFFMSPLLSPSPLVTFQSFYLFIQNNQGVIYTHYLHFTTSSLLLKSQQSGFLSHPLFKPPHPDSLTISSLPTFTDFYFIHIYWISVLHLTIDLSLFETFSSVASMRPYCLGSTDKYICSFVRALPCPLTGISSS